MNADRGSVICWDFDIMKSDVAFSVLRTKVPITHRDEAHVHVHHSGQSRLHTPSIRRQGDTADSKRAMFETGRGFVGWI